MIIKASATHIPLKDKSVHCVVTSPPYIGLRKYNIPDSIWDGVEGCDHQWDEIVVPAANGIIHDGGMSGETLSGNSATRRPQKSKHCVSCGAWEGQLGGEPSIGLYVSHLVQVFREIRRVLRPDGVLWLNLGDSYASGKGSCYNPGGGERSLGKHLKIAGVHYLRRSNISDLRKEGLKPKDLCEIPSEVVRALRDDGWWLRSRIPWIKMNSMPSSCTDRPTATIEYVFLLTKSRKYFYDTEAVRMPMVEYERLRRLREKRQGLKSVYRLKSDGKTGIADQSRTGACRNVAKKHEMAETGSRYRRDSDWFFESLKGMLTNDEGDPLALIVNPHPYKGAHYSSFPEKLVVPMIKAGTSEKGCCPKCGSPWKREVEKTFVPQQDVSLDRGIRGATGQKPMDASSEWDGVPRGSNVVKTIGWQPTCSCDAGDPVPCVVMDPFAGSGTTGVVAEKLNRRWVGLDLGYLELQRERLVGVQKEMPQIG